MSAGLVQRFQRWVFAAIAFAVCLALVGMIWTGWDAVQEAFTTFRWGYLVPVLVLTLFNYALRFVKWHYLLGRLGVEMPLQDDAWNFLAGLAMVISPGKVGELLKPYVVRARTGAPMSRTIPAMITERLTDAMAILALASFGVSTYAADQQNTLIVLVVLIVAGFGVLASPGLSLRILDLLESLPLVGRVVPKLREMYTAMRTCVAPASLLLTLSLSLVAWFAECVGYQLVFWGLGIDAPLSTCVFLYASATLLGGPSPGGLGVAEGALAIGAVNFIPGTTEPQAVAAALIIRAATLWLGVGMGAVALVRISAMLGGQIDLREEEPES